MKVSQAIWFAFGFLCAAGAVALVRDTAAQGQDFAVFWRTARAVLAGEPAYSVARDGAMVFKYPPWILPFFFPLAWLPFETAKWIWGILQVASLGAVALWCRRYCRAEVVACAMVAFWGIWAVHALDGQVSLPILAVALWGWEWMRARSSYLGSLRVRGIAAGFVLLALSTKVFTLIAALGLVPKHGVSRSVRKTLAKTLVFGVVVTLLLSVPALWSTPEAPETPRAVRLGQDWVTAAGSGGAAFPGEQVRNRENQGLPALFLRWLQVPARDTGWDLWVFAGVALVLVFVWAKASRRLSPPERWSGWLALAAVAHPLAWFHSFVLVFPLACFALDRVRRHEWGMRKRWMLAAVLLGWAMVAMITQKTFFEWGLALERASVKSLGALLLLWALTRVRRRVAR